MAFHWSSRHGGCLGVQEAAAVPRYVDDGLPYGGPAEWPTALEGSARAFSGVDYAALGAAVRPQFEDDQTIASARTRAIVVIHRVSYAPEAALLCVGEVGCWALHSEGSSVDCGTHLQLCGYAYVH